MRGLIVRFGRNVLAVRRVFAAGRLLWRDGPGTPLRVLCVAALDAAGALEGRPAMSRDCVGALSTLLDFGAAVNAELDGKPPHDDRIRLRERLNATEVGDLARDYETAVRAAEASRPSTKDAWSTGRRYRERVVEVSFAAAVAASRGLSLSDGLSEIEADEKLCRLQKCVLLCQVIDDALDYPEDRTRRLPGFLTCGSSSLEARRRTGAAVAEYARGGGGLLLSFAAWGLVVVADIALLWAWLRHAVVTRIAGLRSGTAQVLLGIREAGGVERRRVNDR